MSLVLIQVIYGDLIVKNIGENLEKYLEAKRHLWNAYFIDLMGSINECHPLDRFEEIDKNLFLSLVCDPLNIKTPDGFYFGKDFVERVIIKPKYQMLEIPLLISRPSSDGNKYWDEVKAFNTDNVHLAFIEFFDWDKYSFINSALTRCKIVSHQEDVQNEGKEVLIENRLIDFFTT